MKRIALALLAALAAWPAAAGTDKRFEKMLQRIDPSERLEQVCEYAALTKIGHDNRPMRPDRVVMDSISAPKVDGDSMSGSGGAFRSKGKWYQFEFNCQATPDRLKVQSFSYRLGEQIPEDEWERYGLWR